MTVRPIGLGHVPRVATTLARAFRDNPGTLALLAGRDADERTRILRRVAVGFALATVAHGHGEAVFDGDEPIAVSLSFAPEQYPFALGARALISAGPVTAGPRAAMRYARIGAYLERHHCTDPCWYLFMLGVAPDHQGRGLGGTLLRALSRRADDAGVRCYLETDRQTSVKLYERHGYVVTRQDRLAMLDGLEFWTMTRPRRTSNREA